MYLSDTCHKINDQNFVWSFMFLFIYVVFTRG